MHSPRPKTFRLFGARSSKRQPNSRHYRRSQAGGSVGALLLLATLLSCGQSTNLQEEVVASRVQGVSRLVAHRLVTVRTSSATLVTTPEHPFAKVGAGWTRAVDLRRGDRVKTAGGGNATVASVQSREVLPTAVHNLTVSKTHAYFVGSQALLVHNADCGSPSSPSTSGVRQPEEDANERGERSRARRAERKTRLEAKRRKVEQDRMIQHPFNDLPPDMPNCGYCVLAGLSDADTVSTLVRQKNLEPSDPRLSMPELFDLLKAWDLTSENTPAPKLFPALSDLDRARKKVERDLQNGKPHPTFPFQEDAKKFMKASRASTFVLGVKYWDGSQTEQHVLLAVKRDDGSIVYVDLQAVPPLVHDDIDPRSYGAFVVPTDVDWQINWQLVYAVQNGVHEPVGAFAPVGL